MYNVPLLCINRFVLFYFPTWEETLYSNTGTLSMIANSWIFSILVFLPYLVTDSIGFEYYELSVCGIITHGSTWKIGYYHLSLVLACIGFGVTVFCNVKVYQKLRNHAKTVGRSFEKGSVRATNDVLKLTVCCSVCPCLLQLPATLAKPWLNGGYTGHIFALMFDFNSCLSPALTIYFMKPVYREFLRIIRRNTSVHISA